MSGFDRLPGLNRAGGPGLHGLYAVVVSLLASCNSPTEAPPPPEPHFTVRPDTLEFGSLPVDSTRVLHFVLTNVGDAAFSVRPLTSLPAFQTPGLDTTGVRVGPGDSVDVAVAFSPRHPGSKEGQLTLDGSGGWVVACRGWAEGTSEGRVDCSVDPLELDFGALATGESKHDAFSVENRGDAALEGIASVVGTGFRLLRGAGPFSIEPGAWYHVVVEFSPLGVGEKTGRVDLGLETCGGVTCRGYGRGTWRVEVDGSGDAPTVQAAIDSARDGDIVLVGPGRYYENLDLKGKKIHLVGEKGRDETILDGSHGQSSVIVCQSGETNQTVIQGFTITGGTGAHVWSGRYGGGIYCESSSPVIRGNRINGNTLGTSPSGGGAVHIDFPTQAEPVLIEENEVASNESTLNGGGIDISPHGDLGALGRVVIQENLIKGNQTTGDGGGIRIWGWIEGSIIIRHNRIVSNDAGDHGGGLYLGNLSGAEIDAYGNVIVGNLARGHPTPPDCSGGGIWLGEYGAHVHHNTIAYNRAERTDGTFYAIGGVCEVNPTGTTMVDYNLVYRNQEGAFGVYGLGSPGDEWTATFRRNLHYGNVLERVVTGTTHPGKITVIIEDDIIADPLFCVDGVVSRGEIANLSPALNQPWGPIGAVPRGGCGPELSAGNNPAWEAMNSVYGSREPPSRPGGRYKGPR